MELLSISEYVKQMRRRYSLTQVELSQKSGVGLRFVRELEQGKATLRLDKVNLILALFSGELVVRQCNEVRQCNIEEAASDE